MYDSSPEDIGFNKNAIALCEKFGWDYYTYSSQPSFFINTIINQLIAQDQFNKAHGGNSGDKN